MSAWATPGILSKRYWICFSVNSRNSRGGISLETPRAMIGKAVTSNLKMEGAVASRGNCPRARSTLVRTSSSATSMSVPHSKEIRIELDPSEEFEIISLTAGVEARARSMGILISSSISSGPTPAY